MDVEFGLLWIGILVGLVYGNCLRGVLDLGCLVVCLFLVVCFAEFGLGFGIRRLGDDFAILVGFIIIGGVGLVYLTSWAVLGVFSCFVGFWF